MTYGITKRETLFFIALITYTIRSFVDVLAIDELSLVQTIAKAVLMLDFLLLSAKLAADFSQNLISFEKVRIIVLGLAIAIIILIFSKSSSYVFIWMMICAAHNINFRKIALAVSLTMLITELSIFSLCALGILKNTKQTGGSETIIRYAYGMGFKHYWEAAHLTFNTVVVYLYAREEHITWFELVALAILEFVVYTFTTTRNPFAVGMITLVICALLKLSPWLREYRKAYGVVARWIHPICAAFIVLLSAKCDLESESIQKFNKLLTGRLRLGQSAIKQYGIKPFGQHIVWSLGGSDGPYNIVDSSYLCVLLEFGLVFLLLLLIMFYVIGRYSSRHRDTYLVILTVAIAVHATFDMGLISFPGNVMFFVLSYLFCYQETDIGDIRIHEHQTK